MSPVVRIDSPRNPKIKLARSLHSPKGRREAGLYLVEGPGAVAEALLYAPGIEWVAWCPDLCDALGDELADAASQAKLEVLECTREAFEALSDTRSPQGIAAVLRIEPQGLDAIDISGGGAVLVMHDLRDPGNLGTTIRSADAFGAVGVILTGSCADPYEPKVVRATAGSLFHLPVVEAEWGQVAGWARDLKVSVYATALEGSHAVGKVGIPKRVALVIGNEARGLPQSILQDATYTVTIPMSGRAESLNAAVAAGVVLFEAQRQRLAG